MVRMEGEKPHEGELTSITIFDSIQTRSWEHYGQMLVKAKVCKKNLEAMIDMGAEAIYMAKELIDEIGMPYRKSSGFVKEVDKEMFKIDEKAHGVDIEIGL